MDQNRTMYSYSHWLLYLLVFFCLPLNASGQHPDLSFSNVPAEVTIFSPGIISTNLYERDMAISPDGNEIFFTLQSNQGKFSSIVHMERNAQGIWTKPELASFSGVYSDMEPAFTADGKKLFFVSNRSLTGDSLKDFDIWTVEKEKGQWVNPVNLGAPVNTAENEFYPSVAANGNLYFTANYSIGKGKEDIYEAKWEQGKYAQPISLDTAVNSSFYEFNAFVSPDEQFIIFTSFGRKDDMGRGDLYLSQKDASGNWQMAKNMKWVNSDRLDYCPFVSFDRKIFFFTSERSKLMEQFNPAATYQSLQSLYNGVMNGLANIYWVSFEKVLSEMK